MSVIEAGRVTVNRNFTVSDVWCVHDFLLWAHSRGYVFARMHGFSFTDADASQVSVFDDATVSGPKAIHVLNFELANRETELRSVILEFFSAVMQGETTLTL